MTTESILLGVGAALGFWLGTLGIFVFLLVVTLITAFITGILDRGKKKGPKDGQ